MNLVREWAQRLLMPAMLTCIGLLQVALDDSRAAGAFQVWRSRRYLERMLERNPDADYREHFEVFVEWLEGAQHANFRFSNQLLLTFVVFSLAWLALAREPLRFRLLTFAAVWLGCITFSISRPIY